MKRVFGIAATLVVIAAVLWALPVLSERRLQGEFDALDSIGGVGERIDAAVAVAEAHPGMELERFDELATHIAEAAYASGDFATVVTVVDSLRATDLVPALDSALARELHDALMILRYYNDDEASTDRAANIARALLERDDVSADSYAGMANIGATVLTYKPVEGSAHYWLLRELALAGYEGKEELDAVVVGALTASHRELIKTVAVSRGLDGALAFADSLLSEDAGDPVAAAIHAARFSLAIEDDQDVALEAAQDLLATADAPGFSRTLNSISYELIQRDMALDVGLALGERALELASSRRDSINILDTVGWAHYKLGQYDPAARRLEEALALADEVLEYDDVTVQHLLTVYDEAGDDDRTVDFLATLIARSLDPNVEARERLAELLAVQGRKDSEISELVARRRYEGVEEAPEFTLLTDDGETVSLSDYRGNVVLLCFWSYG